MKAAWGVVLAFVVILVSSVALGAAVEVDPSPVPNDDMSARFGGAGERAQSIVPVAAAFGASNYLVAWSEFRTSGVHLFATRVSESGVVLDPSPKALASFPYFVFFGILGARSISVVHSKGGFLVTWVDSGDFTVQYVRGVRIKDDGSVLDATPLDLGTVYEPFSWNLFGGNYVYPTAYTVAASDDACMVLAVGEGRYRDGYTFQRSLTATSFTGLWGNAPPVRSSVEISPGAQGPGAITSDGSDFYAAWQETTVDGDAGAVTHSRVARLSGSGAVAWKAETAPEYLPNFGSFSGGNALFVAASGSDAKGLLVAPSGSLTGPFAMPTITRVWQLNSKGSGFAAAVSTASIEYCSQALNAAGVPTGTCVDIGESVSEKPPLFASGASTVLTGSYPFVSTYEGLDARSNKPLAVSVRNPSTLAKIANVSLSRAANAQSLSAIAFDGKKYLVVWVDDRESEKDPASNDPASVYAARVDTDGKVGAAVKISDSHLVAASRPAIVFDGTKFYATWQQLRVETTDVMSLTGVEISSSLAGESIETSHRVQLSDMVSNGNTWPAVSSDGENRLIVWIGPAPSTLAVRVSISTGVLLDTIPIELGSAAGPVLASGVSTISPAIAFDGESHFIVYPVSGDVFTANLVAVLMKKGAAVPSGVPFKVQASLGVQYNPVVASDGKTGVFLAWADLLSSDGAFDIRGKVIKRGEYGSAEGAPSLGLGVASGEQMFPAVAYANDGVGYAIAWADIRDRRDHAIYGNFVGTDGRVFEGASGVLLDASSRGDTFPALASGPVGSVGLVYSHFDLRPGFANERVYFASISSGTLVGGSCLTSDDCASHYCVGGVCCGTACEGACETCAVTAETRGTCGVASKGTICGERQNYTCDGTATECRGTCDVDTDCASGFRCTEHSCVGASGGGCLDDHTLSSGFSCGAYRCVGGTCATSCASADDCLAPQVCDFSGRCVDPPSIVNAADGCSVSTIPSSSWGFAAMLAASVILAKRRRNKHV